MESKIVAKLNAHKRWYKNPFVRIIKVVVIIIIILIALLFSISILLFGWGPHGPTNDSGARATCRALAESATIEKNKKSKYYWDTPATFGDDFSHVSPKSGYLFTYISNGTPPSEKPEDDDATRFIYVAIPFSKKTGKTVIYIDETKVVFEADFKPDKVNWNAPIVADWSVDGPKRLTSPKGVEWKVR